MDIDNIGMIAQAAKAEALQALRAGSFELFARAEAIGNELEFMAEEGDCRLSRVQEVADRADDAQLLMAQEIWEELAWAMTGE